MKNSWNFCLHRTSHYYIAVYKSYNISNNYITNLRSIVPSHSLFTIILSLLKLMWNKKAIFNFYWNRNQTLKESWQQWCHSQARCLHLVVLNCWQSYINYYYDINIKSTHTCSLYVLFLFDMSSNKQREKSLKSLFISDKHIFILMTNDDDDDDYGDT